MQPRKTKLKRNARGVFTRELGYLDRVRRKQPKFSLGTDEKQAEIRVARISEVFDECRRITDLPMWTDFGLYAARLIGRGIYRIPYQPEWDLLGVIEDEPTLEDKCAEYVQMLRVRQAEHPSLEIVPSEEEMYAYGVGLNRAFETAVVKNMEKHFSELGVLSSERRYPEQIVAGTLHEAFDAYVERIKSTGHRLSDNTLKYSQRKRIKYVQVLKEQHEDRPLMMMTDFDSIEDMLGHWGKRPEYAKGKRYNPTSARHRLKELQRFLKWLDRTSEFNWQLPPKADTIRVEFVELEEDHASSELLTKKVYTPQQLGVIARYAKDLDRLLLLSGVNCAFGAAEVGRLITNEVLLRHEHEYAERLHFATTAKDSFIRFMRPKSGMFGEWLLWQETADILEWGVRRAEKLGTSFLVTRESGVMLYQEKNQNPQAGFANRWKKLIKRIQKEDSEFPYLPFGSLRDTLPDVLRHRYSDDLASICLAHKTVYKPDNLLEAYGNKPFGRLHNAIRELRDHFEPMLSAK